MTNFGWRACMIGVLVITAMSIEVKVATTRAWCTEANGDLGGGRYFEHVDRVCQAKRNPDT